MKGKVKRQKKLGLFEAFGIELEYMIVDRETLDVRPIADRLFRDVAGTNTNEIDRGSITWSNELVLHLIELKTNGPAPSLKDLDQQFQHQVMEINGALEQYNACLMPTGMHPWMNPFSEMKLWPYENNEIYEAYNRIFDCRGHGWANLQSIHINLPFANDEEFEKLHAAIRVLLPILPGIAASSPVVDGEFSFFADYRMEVYRNNSNRIPSVTGYVIPEQAFSYEEYDRKIFQRMYRDITSYDPDEILRDEWLNSRGAIARFDRGSIEIRVLDIQECPMADLAIAQLVIDTLKGLVAQRWSSLEMQRKWNEIPLHEVLLNVIKKGEWAVLQGDYLELFGIEGKEPITVKMLWNHIYDYLYQDVERPETDQGTVSKIIDNGTLSSRILRTVSDPLTDDELKKIYRELCNCLAEGKLFAINE